jgi:ribulose-phosphate 3-epimerase
MTVEPGFGGQKFKKSVLPKIKKAGEKIKQVKAEVKLEVDGGINKETLPLVIAAGGEILVIGSAIFS